MRQTHIETIHNMAASLRVVVAGMLFGCIAYGGARGYEIYQKSHRSSCCGGLKQIGLPIHSNSATQNVVTTTAAPIQDQEDQ